MIVYDGIKTEFLRSVENDTIAGPGWELINDKTKVNFNELTVSGKDVYQ